MGSARDRFQAMLAQHEKIVFKVAGMYCRNAEDRRDLAQEICVQAWRSFGSYDAARSFSTWMYRIALNVAISFARSAGHRDRHAIPLDEESHDIADDSATLHEPDERIRALHQFIDQLDVLNRALMLLYLEDRSYREIADVLGITETNVATKINRLKQRIRSGISETQE
ncbi:MAG TPA: sigma-70 family RNA polymerase sigma factor [Xanthomonadaceae bacterium]|nr:sigma-70 family RNA polymerase sigma factor [Xanthomonadaceae bacterium]